MKFSSDNFEAEFEKAIRFLTKAMPPAEKLVKPTLLHNIRVAIYLYTHGHDRETCLAGLLHDVIEDTPVTYLEVEKEFGTNVAKLVQANTKNEDLHDMKKFEDLMRRCIEAGEKGAVIKAIDILDNFIYYSKIDDKEAIEWMIKTGNLLLSLLPSDFNDPIFMELRNTINV